jgi:hypothetical protein
MSNIRIVKGYPFSLFVEATQANTALNLNDGSWTTDIQLRWQTEVGPSPFVVSSLASGNGYIVELTSEQTESLDSRGSGYVLVTTVEKTDGTVVIRSKIPVNVANDI